MFQPSNMAAVKILHSQNNKIVWLSNMADTFWEIHEVRKDLWALSSRLYFSGYWLAEQGNLITWLKPQPYVESEKTQRRN